MSPRRIKDRDLNRPCQICKDVTARRHNPDDRMCVTCRKAYNARYYLKNRDRVRRAKELRLGRKIIRRKFRNRD